MPYFTHRKDRSLLRGDVAAYVNDTDLTNVACEDAPIDVWIYQTAQAANEQKIALQRKHGEPFTVSFFPTAEQTNEWRRRERRRFATGAYVQPPWHDALGHYYPEHYAHMSVALNGQIAYTQTAEHGIADRQTRVRPGKYLLQYFGEDSEQAAQVVPADERLTKAQVDAYVAQCSASALTLQITQTAQEAEYVYVNGPRSCMSRSADRYQGHVHPAQVYGGEHSDLRLAYTGDLDGRISARCVVWPEKKIAVRVYPDMSSLTVLLKHNGYAVHTVSDMSGVLNGARIAAIEDRNGNGWIMPYVDGIDNAWLTSDRKSFVLGKRDDRCSDRYSRGEYVVDTQQTQESENETIAAGVTEPHNNEEDNFTCDHCGDSYPEDSRSGHDSSLCDGCGDSLFVTCHHCETSIDTRDESLTRVTTGSGYSRRTVRICDGCIEEISRSCEDCGDTWYDGYDSADHGDDDRLCGDCHEKAEEAKAQEDAEETEQEDTNDPIVPVVPGNETIDDTDGYTLQVHNDPNGHSDERSRYLTDGEWTVCCDIAEDVSGVSFARALARYEQLRSKFPTYRYRIVRDRDSFTVRDTIAVSVVAEALVASQVSL